MKIKMFLLVLCLAITTGALQAQSLKMVSVMPEQVVTADRLTVSNSFDFKATQLGSDAAKYVSVANFRDGVGDSIARMEVPAGSNMKYLVVDGALVAENITLNAGGKKKVYVYGVKDSRGSTVSRPAIKVEIGDIDVGHIYAAELFAEDTTATGKFNVKKVNITQKAASTLNAKTANGVLGTGLYINGQEFPAIESDKAMYWELIALPVGGSIYALVRR